MVSMNVFSSLIFDACIKRLSQSLADSSALSHPYSRLLLRLLKASPLQPRRAVPHPCSFSPIPSRTNEHKSHHHTGQNRTYFIIISNLVSCPSSLLASTTSNAHPSCFDWYLTISLARSITRSVAAAEDVVSWNQPMCGLYCVVLILLCCETAFGRRNCVWKCDLNW